LYCPVYYNFNAIIMLSRVFMDLLIQYILISLSFTKYGVSKGTTLKLPKLLPFGYIGLLYSQTTPLFLFSLLNQVYFIRVELDRNFFSSQHFSTQNLFRAY